MTIKRLGELPPFWQYAVKYALCKNKNDPIKDWSDLVKELDPEPILIPSYQRNIVWKDNEIKEFIGSDAILFGTVILASSKDDKATILLDGLQRFALATAMLNYLYPIVLSNEPDRQDLEHKFTILKAEVAAKRSIFQHNDRILSSYPRMGIQESYIRLKNSVNRLFDKEFNENALEFSEKISKMFVKKQIALDPYFDFKDESELIHTFINLNSTGLDLSQVDLLRSLIIQQAEKKKWYDDDITEFENRFTNVFQSKDNKWSKRLGKYLYDSIKTKPTLVFKNWDNLKSEDVDDLLKFIEDFDSALTKEDENNILLNPYLYEIFQCGELPITIVFWYYYKYVHLDNKIPDFMDGDYDSTKELHLLLRVFYRRVIDNSLTRLDKHAKKFMCNNLSGNILTDLVDSINNDVKLDNIKSSPNKEWLKINIQKSNSDAIRRIFNACLLPDRNADVINFKPIMYGNKSSMWNLDHMIPKKSKSQDIIDEMNQIVNLSPLPSDINVRAKHFPCSKKLSDDGLYPLAKNKHPYIMWLVSIHYKKYNNDKIMDSISDKTYEDVPVFDSKYCLIRNSEYCVGDDRINEIAKQLIDKI